MAGEPGSWSEHLELDPGESQRTGRRDDTRRLVGRGDYQPNTFRLDLHLELAVERPLVQPSVEQ
jgi:hypothetical protein